MSGVAPVSNGAAPGAGASLRVSRTITLVGLMGAGKSAIGRKLAQRLNLPFVDADSEIEQAAGCSIDEIFDRYGETAFRQGERRVMDRLLDGPVCVLATGGGAFMDPEIRAKIKERTISVWLYADLDVLVRRVSRRNNRPLLKRGEPREVLERLIGERYPIYAEADIRIDSDDAPSDATADRLERSLAGFLEAGRAGGGHP